MKKETECLGSDKVKVILIATTAGLLHDAIWSLENKQLRKASNESAQELLTLPNKKIDSMMKAAEREEAGK